MTAANFLQSNGGQKQPTMESPNYQYHPFTSNNYDNTSEEFRLKQSEISAMISDDQEEEESSIFSTQRPPTTLRRAVSEYTHENPRIFPQNVPH